MSIFEIPTDQTPAAQLLAKGFLAEANQAFETQLNAVYDTVDRFWYLNRDAEGVKQLEGDEPSGLEILTAMGPNAKAVIDIAYARVVMLLTIQAGLGLSGIVDMTKVASPYELTFNPDGSLSTWTLKQ